METLVREYLDHNEWEVALGLLADLHQGWRPTTQGWDLLIEAAELMWLTDTAAGCRWGVGALGRWESIHGIVRAEMSRLLALGAKVFDPEYSCRMSDRARPSQCCRLARRGPRRRPRRRSRLPRTGRKERSVSHSLAEISDISVVFVADLEVD